MIDLKGKRILYFAPSSFGYEYEIKNELERRGAMVDYYNERPSNTTLVKALIRINKKSVRFYTNRYFNNIIRKNSGTSYDFIFVLRGEALSPIIVKNLRSSFPGARLILYLWDSIKNNNTLEIIPFFDKVMTFDSSDVKKYSILKFRPLFFLPEYEMLSKNSQLPADQVLFVGTVHSDRYFFVKKIETYLRANNFNTDFYFYFPSKLLFLKKRLTDKSFERLTLKDFNYIPLNKKDLLEKVNDSNVILDIQHPNQHGLTMRCIEALGAKRKLVTTNTEIVKYDFYSKNNIFVINRDFYLKSEELDKLFSFIRLPYKDIDSMIYYKYSLEEWMNEVFS